MAPTANGDASMPLIPRIEPSIVEGRSFSPSVQGNMGSVLHNEEVELLGALTIAAATISIISGSLSLFWFLRMRRAFRHQFVTHVFKIEAKLMYSLIMLLILSNLWRALWYFLFPIVGFARGTISSQSSFCQVSGFMLSYGIEGAGMQMRSCPFDC
jgi:G protein-coupled receptor GPR1